MQTLILEHLFVNNANAHLEHLFVNNGNAHFGTLVCQ